MESGAAPLGSATRVGPDRSERVLVWVGLPLVGAGAGWLLKVLAGWAASLRWVPFHRPLEWLGSAPEPHATIGSLVVGAVAGVLLALLAEDDYVTVTVADDQVTVVRGESSRSVPRASIDAVFRRDKELVLLGHRTEELVRQRGDLPAAGRLEAGFVAHGYRWLPGGDPHQHEYLRWVDGTRDLPTAANALLAARARALDRGGQDGAHDAERLREELAELGVVVHEESKRQYWRRTRQPAEPSGDAPAP